MVMVNALLWKPVYNIGQGCWNHMRELKAKPAGKFAVIIPLCYLLFMMFVFGVRLLDSPLTADNIFLIAVICIGGTFIIADYAGRRYTLNQDGFHQHWFLHTDHYAWDSFTEVSIEPASENVRIICFNRNVSYVSQIGNGLLHPFRFFSFSLADSNSEKYDRDFKEDEILELLKENGIRVVYYFSSRG